MAEYVFESDSYTDTFVRDSDNDDRSGFSFARIGKNPPGEINRYLFYCDISSVSGTVESAILRILVYFTQLAGEPIIVRRTAETDWTSAASWQTKDGATPWTTLLGGDPVVVPGQSQFSLPTYPLPQPVNIDVTDIVNDAIDNRSGILGLILQLDDENAAAQAALYQAGNTRLSVSTANEHTLTLDVGSNGSAAATGTGVVDEGGGVYTCPDGAEVTVTITPDSGFQIDEITGDAVLQPDGTYLITMLEDETVAITFVAYWALVLTTSGNGSVDASPGPDPTFGEYKDGTVVTLTVDPDDNNNFDAWSGADSGDVGAVGGAVYEITMDADKTIQADFAVDTYLLTLDIGANGDASVLEASGIVDNEDDTYTCDYGVQATIFFTPDADKSVNRDSITNMDTVTQTADADDGSFFGFKTVVANVTVAVTFRAAYQITWTEAGGDHGDLTELPGSWNRSPSFDVPSADGFFVVTPDPGYQVRVTSDDGEIVLHAPGGPSGGDAYFLARSDLSGYSPPSGDTEVTYTWVAIAAGQARQHVFPAPWVDKPWVDHPIP